MGVALLELHFTVLPVVAENLEASFYLIGRFVHAFVLQVCLVKRFLSPKEIKLFQP